MSWWKMAILGNLIVNLPVTIAILGLTLYWVSELGFSFHSSLLFSVIVGWILWSYLLKLWVKFCLKRGATKDEVFRAGRLGLVNFWKRKIDQVNLKSGD